VLGVVGWVDLTAEAVVFPADPLLKGVRPMLQDIAETEWIMRPEVLRGLAALRDAGLRLDALARVRHLPVLRDLARAVPGLPVVIDHAAKPEIEAGNFDVWADGMAVLADETYWCCKFSGLVTEAGADWDLARLRPYTEHLLRCFGGERLMFGSDWPVVTNASSYARWFDAAWALVPADDRAAVFGATAARFYGVTLPPG
jgi:L-fuconolactonase